MGKKDVLPVFNFTKADFRNLKIKVVASLDIRIKLFPDLYSAKFSSNFKSVKCDGGFQYFFTAKAKLPVVYFQVSVNFYTVTQFGSINKNFPNCWDSYSSDCKASHFLGALCSQQREVLFT